MLNLILDIKKRVHFHELFSNLERKTGFEPATPTMAR